MLLIQEVPEFYSCEPSAVDDLTLMSDRTKTAKALPVVRCQQRKKLVS
jgi:hypothetical protein